MATQPAATSQAPQRSAPASALDRFQPEIQGLRAVAVLLVVIYHLWPNRLPGGFVGVDVFFVISGFLITAHIYREVRDTGHLKLAAFWGRRVRRLLPLGFLVLAVSAAIALAVIPATAWGTTFRQIIASALYVQNWVLAADAVDYSAMDESATVVQHYWSLSVEEQFYIVWPLLLTGLLFLVSRLRRGTVVDSRRVLIVGLTGVGVVSFAWSIAATAYDPATAYFITPTRMWEFVVGALVALVFMGRQLGGRLGNLLGWLGIAMLLTSGLLYSASTPFPGYTALLPVLGTALVMVAGGTTPVTGVHWWLSVRPARFIGDVSYGMYLWHWPFIVAAPFLFVDGFTWRHKLGILLLTILVSWASKVLIEDPFRIRPWIKTLPRAYAFAATGMAAIVALSAFAPGALQNAQRGPVLSSGDECYGYEALADGCTPIEGELEPFPAPAEVAAAARNPLFPGCQAESDDPEVVSCELGVPVSEAEAVIAVVGDSHATAWLPTLEVLAQRNSWSIRTYTRSACTPSTADRVMEGGNTATRRLAELCTEKNREVANIIAGDAAVDAVFTAASAVTRPYEDAAGAGMEDPQVEGFTTMWQRWIDTGKHVVAIDEIPRMANRDVPECVETHRDELAACTVARKDAFPQTANIARAAESMSASGFHEVDMTNGFCDDTTCYPVVGTLITYYDKSHVSVEYARSLAPLMEKQLEGTGLLKD
ncbi:acyltransferase family protein [Zafaria sp. Z1313]|uniref:acyltransferase family protein n=1 Tax=Zafaria sp. Z1313 TaxID=3423202 RepID=UPI003D302BD6